jgi:hypothetical protein
MGMAPVARDQILPRPEGAGEEAAPEGRIGHERDPKFIDQRQQLPLRIAGPKGVLRLQGRDRVDRVGAADGVEAGLAEAKMVDLALFHETGHGPDRVGDRHLRVDPVLVVEVDRLDPEPPQARCAGLRHVVGMAVVPPRFPFGPRMLPNFVQTKTSSRRPLSARPRSSSFRPAP